MRNICLVRLTGIAIALMAACGGDDDGGGGGDAGVVPDEICEGKASGELAWAWLTPIGGSDPAVSVGDDGVASVTGTFSNEEQFDPVGGTALLSSYFDSMDPFVVRVGPGGAFLSARHDGSTALDRGMGTATASDGSFYVVGMFEGTAIFGEGEANETQLVAGGQEDAYVARYADDGTLLWARRAGGTGGVGMASARSVGVAGDGGARVFGAFSESITLGEGESGEITFDEASSFGLQDGFLAAFEPDGTLDWASAHTNLVVGSSPSLAVADDGSMVLAAGGNALLNVGQANELQLTGGQGLFVATMEPDGTVTWYSISEGGNSSQGPHAAVASDGSIYVSGWFRDEATFGIGEPGMRTLVAKADSDDIYLARYLPGEGLDWVKQMASVTGDAAYGLTTTSDNMVHMVGRHEGGLVIDEGLPTAQEIDGNASVLVSAASDGAVVNAFSPGEMGQVYLSGLAATPGAQSMRVIGSYSGTVTFGPGQPNEMNFTAELPGQPFIARYDVCP